MYTYIFNYMPYALANVCHVNSALFFSICANIWTLLAPEHH